MNPLDPLQQDEIESQNYLSGHRYNAKLTMIFFGEDYGQNTCIELIFLSHSFPNKIM